VAPARRPSSMSRGHAQTPAPVLAAGSGQMRPLRLNPPTRPANGVARMRVGTPPVIQNGRTRGGRLACLDGVDMTDIPGGQHRPLTPALYRRGRGRLALSLELAKPAIPQTRALSGVVRHAEGYAAMQACIAHGVVGGFSARRMICAWRLAPLFIDADDVGCGA